MNLVAVDIVALVIILVAAIRCTFRGFVAELMAFAALIVGVAAAIIFGGMVTPLLENYLGQTFWTPIAAFLGTFLIAYLLMKLFEGALHRVIDKINLEKLDQALGFFLGAVEGVLLLLLLYFLINIQPLFDVEPLFNGSKVAPVLEKLLPLGQEFMNSAIRNNSV
jgi:membrane protein required for colicin V production